MSSEAAPLIERAARWTLADDIDAQMGLLGARASLLADQGDLDAAQRLAQEAVELAAQTDYLNTHAGRRSPISPACSSSAVAGMRR